MTCRDVWILSQTSIGENITKTSQKHPELPKNTRNFPERPGNFPKHQWNFRTPGELPKNTRVGGGGWVGGFPKHPGKVKREWVGLYPLTHYSCIYFYPGSLVCMLFSILVPCLIIYDCSSHSAHTWLPSETITILSVMPSEYWRTCFAYPCWSADREALLLSQISYAYCIYLILSYILLG